MLLILGNGISIRVQVFGLLYAATLLRYSTGTMYELDDCRTQDNAPGICRTFSQCQHLVDKIKSGAISIYDPVRCGFAVKDEIICCPAEIETVPQTSGSPILLGPNTSSSTTTTTTTTTTTKTPIKQPNQVNIVRSERPAVEACRIIVDDLSPILTPHILGGTEVEAGDYPHMAAIGYTTIGNEGGPYDFRCGGTLIHERFVLTAAHCVNSRNVTPAIVRLGMSNFDDVEEIENRVEVPIENIYIHPNYSQLNKINDVALLEFARPVEKTRYISPTCLYTETANPKPGADLYVAGWGVYNYTTGKKSNALLKARMTLVPDADCKAAYRDQGYILQDAHLCATDAKNINDACWGDSGGPLLLHVDESTFDYRQVGIISAGYGCAGNVPGLYMKVSSYLDYIESIVWPSN